MATSKDYTSVDAYINDQEAEVKEKLNTLRKCVLTAAPDATELFNYGIPAFALVEGGKREQQIMIAGYKKHVGLYPHPTIMEHFAEELSQYKKGKGSVQFPLNQPLPEELIVEMIKYRLDMITESQSS